MSSRKIKTSDIARTLGVHVNTIRLYEADGYLPEVTRSPNGYRQFTPLHMEHARLAYLALHWPYLSDKLTQIELVKSAAKGDYGMAMERAYQHLAFVRMERTFAESAIEFLERRAGGHLIDAPREQVHITEAARYLHLSVDMLRNWERNGLIDVPRDSENQYRLYGTAEFGRLRVIRILVQSGHSLMAILRMFQQFDAGKRDNLRSALNLPPEDSANEYIATIADRWLANLVEQEERAQTIIRQVARLIEMVHAAR